MRWARYRRTDQTIDDYIVDFALPRRRAESEMEMGAGFPGQVSSILRMNNAGLSGREESLVMASSHKSLKVNVRR